MPYGLYISAAGADVQSQRMQILSHNLANVDTPGFKREFAVIQARAAEAVETGQATEGDGSINDVGGGVSLAETMTDFAAGAFRQTGLPTDMAIDGDGFFVVDKNGDQMLTRAGNFRFTPNGELKTAQGYNVLAEGGEPIAINPSLPWDVSDDGRITQAGVQIPLALVEPGSLGDLVRSGENLFSPLATTFPVPVSERRVISGYVEQSSVKPAQEMMELIETSRAYESNVRMIQNQDQMIGALVNRVLTQS